MQGYIAIHRKIFQWGWYKHPITSRLFFHLLLLTNHQDNECLGCMIKRGQLITSIKNLATELGVSVQNIRTSIKHLKSTNELTIKTTTKFSLITMKNYNEYQKLTNNLTNDQQTTNKRLTTNNKGNKDNKEKKYIKKSFSDYVRLTEKEYSRLIEDFGLSVTEEYIQRLDEYIPNSKNGKNYKDHNKVVRKWLRDSGVGKRVDWTKFKNNDTTIEDTNIAKFLKKHPEHKKQAQEERPTAHHLSQFI